MSQHVTIIRTWGSALKLAMIFLVSGACVGAVVSLAVVFKVWEAQQEPAPALVCAPAPGGGTEHLAIDGRPVLVKGVVEPRPGRLLSYCIDFGDGSDPATGTVKDLNLSFSHLYPTSPLGTRYTATLTVTDDATGATAVGDYPIEFVESTTDNKVAIALDDGLWRLHVTQKRVDDPICGEIGYWNESHYPLASTAMATLAFEVNGFDSRAERRGSPYSETVERALAYLLTHAEKQELPADPKTRTANGNGFALTVPGKKVNYELPLVTMALVASRDPERLATTGYEGVRGRTYKALVQDMLETIWNGQTVGNKRYRGGWRYLPRSRKADMSVTQWPVLAMMSAEEVFGVATPQEVKDELRDGFLLSAQHKGGGFTYRGDGKGSVRLTGAGLISLAFVDVGPEDDRTQKACAFVAENWETGNIGDTYAMYAVMKGAKLTGGGIDSFGEHDWRTEYAEHLFSTQKADGGWAEDQYAKGALSSAWPALILSKDVFATARPAELDWRIIAAAGGGGVGFLGLIVLLVFVAKAPVAAAPAAVSCEGP